MDWIRGYIPTHHVEIAKEVLVGNYYTLSRPLISGGWLYVNAETRHVFKRFAEIAAAGTRVRGRRIKLSLPFSIFVVVVELHRVGGILIYWFYVQHVFMYGRICRVRSCALDSFNNLLRAFYFLRLI